MEGRPKVHKAASRRSRGVGQRGSLVTDKVYNEFSKTVRRSFSSEISSFTCTDGKANGGDRECLGDTGGVDGRPPRGTRARGDSIARIDPRVRVVVVVAARGGRRFAGNVIGRRPARRALLVPVLRAARASARLRGVPLHARAAQGAPAHRDGVEGVQRRDRAGAGSHERAPPRAHATAMVERRRRRRRGRPRRDPAPASRRHRASQRAARPCATPAASAPGTGGGSTPSSTPE